MKMWQWSVIKLVATMGVLVIAFQLPTAQSLVLLACTMIIGHASTKEGEMIGLLRVPGLIDDMRKVRAEIATEIEKMEKMTDDLKGER